MLRPLLLSILFAYLFTAFCINFLAEAVFGLKFIDLVYLQLILLLCYCASTVVAVRNFEPLPDDARDIDGCSQ